MIIKIYVTPNGDYGMNLLGDMSKAEVEHVNRIVTSQLRFAGYSVKHECDAGLRGKIKMGR